MKAGDPFREHGIRAIAKVAAALGPIDSVLGDWRSIGSDPDLPFDDWRLTVRCEGGTAQARLTFPGPKLEVKLPLAARLAARVRPHAVDDADIVRWVADIARGADEEQAERLAKLTHAERVPFLVTGANGSLGRAIVARLVAAGHRVRAFQRRAPSNPDPRLDYALGNLADDAAVDAAVKGAQVVIHAGAAMKGGWKEHEAGTVRGTENVLASCKRHGVKQLVYVSSMSVIDWAGATGTIDETAQLEPRAGERGAYTRAKLEAEILVSHAAEHGLPAVILRPGQIFGGGIPLVNGAVARGAAGRWLILGDGTLELPLVYLDDVVDAIIAAIEKRLVDGEIVQVIDPEHLTQRDVLDAIGGGRRIVRVPRGLVFALGKLSELPLRAVGKQSPVALYRLQSAMARLHYDSARAKELLGWQPRVGVREGIKRVSARPAS